MADKNEIVEKLIEGVPEGIKAIVAELQTLKSGFDSSQKSIIDYLNKAIEGFEKMKKAASFAEFREENAKYAASFKELTNVINAQNKMSEKIIALEKQLVAERKKNAKEIVEYRQQLQETAKAQKASNDSITMAKKALDDYGIIIKEGANSIKSLREENKLLNKIVNELDVKTQGEEIDRLNKIIEGNTAVIDLNKDSWTQSKNNIGKYQTAITGFGEKIKDITAQMDKVRQETGEHSNEFKRLQRILDETKKSQQEYEGRLKGLSVENDNLKAKLSGVRNEMQNLALIGNDKTWSEEQKKQYRELQKEAVKLQTAINAVKTQTKELAQNNLALRGWSDAMSTSVATIQLAEKGMNDLGISTQSYREILVKLQYAQATINSLETISAKLRANSTMMIALQSAAQSKHTVVVKAATAAQWLLNNAQKAMPFLAAAMFFVGIISWLSKLSKSTKEAADAQKDLNDVQQKGIENAKKEGEALTSLVAKINSAAKGSKERAEAIEEFNKAYGNYLPNLITEKTTTEELQKAYEKLIPLMLKKAMASALDDKARETGGKIVENLLKEIQLNEELQELYDEQSRMFEGIETEADVVRIINSKRYNKLQAEQLDIKNKLNDIDADNIKLSQTNNTVMEKWAQLMTEIADATTGAYDVANAAAELREQKLKTEEQLWKDLTKEIENYLKEQEKLLITPEDDTLAKQLKDELKDLEFQLKMTMKAIQRTAEVVQMGIDDQITALTESYNRGEISAQEYQDRVFAIKEAGNRAIIEAQIAFVEKELSISEISFEQRLSFEQKLFELKRELRKEEAREADRDSREAIKREQERAKKMKDISKELSVTLIGFLKEQSDAKIEAFNEELARIDEWKTRELERLNESVMSEETRAAETKRINEQAEADKKAIEAKRRQEQIKQFVFDKLAALAQAGINIGLGITSALSMMPAGIALAAVVGALGAVQLAMIAAKQPPKYAKGIYGDESHPGGWAMIGDAFKKEYALTPQGKLIETPAKPAYMYLQKGTQVFPDYATMQRNLFEIPKYDTTATQMPDFSEGMGRLEKAFRESKTVQNVSLNLDSSGIWYVANGKNTKNRFINKYIFK